MQTMHITSLCHSILLFLTFMTPLLSIYPHPTLLQGSGQGHEYLLQALRQGGLGGAPLILSPRLQGLQVNSMIQISTQLVDNKNISGAHHPFQWASEWRTSSSHQPCRHTGASVSQNLSECLLSDILVARYAHYGITDYSNYAAGLTSPLLADYTADAAGGLFAR